MSLGLARIYRHRSDHRTTVNPSLKGYSAVSAHADTPDTPRLGKLLLLGSGIHRHDHWCGSKTNSGITTSHLSHLRRSRYCGSERSLSQVAMAWTEANTQRMSPRAS